MKETGEEKTAHRFFDWKRLLCNLGCGIYVFEGCNESGANEHGC
jgi:hypothetical protein